jgi:hypothetical protein
MLIKGFFTQEPLVKAQLLGQTPFTLDLSLELLHVLKISYNNFKIDPYRSCISFTGTQLS